MAPGGRSRRQPTLPSSPPATNLAPSSATTVPPIMPNISQSVPSSSTTATNSVETNSMRKGRGKAKNISLAKHIETSGRRIRIEIPQGCLRPVGKGSKLFLSEVGIITRTYMPVTCLNWKMVEDHLKNLYNHILDKFDIDLHIAHVKLAVDDYIKNRYKDHRHKIRTHFRKFGGNITARNNPYDGIKEEYWVMLCNHFMDDKYQKRCKTNSDNRKKLEVNHFGGSKSFQQHREELREKNQPHGMINVYEHTHYDPKKGWVHQKAKDNHDSMVAVQSEHVPEGTTPPTEEEICEKVLGPKAFFGQGAKPTSTSRLRQCNRVEMEQSNKRAEAAEKRNDKLVQQLQDMQNRQSQMEIQLQALLVSQQGSTPTS